MSVAPDKLSGIYPMLVTPFAPDGSLALGQFDGLIEAMLGAGVAGVAALGIGGEVASLSPEERLAVADRVLERVGGRVPVVIGATASDTESACTYAKRAAAAGARVVMVAPPSDPPLSGRAELLVHFAAVADAIGDAELMVQDAPQFLGVALDTPMIEDLAQSRLNIGYAKTEALPAGEAVDSLRAARARGTTIFGGQAGLHAIDVFDAGAAGIIPGCELAAPLVRLHRAYVDGDRADAVARHRRMLPLLNFMFQDLGHYLRCTKWLLAERGLIDAAATRTGATMSSWSVDALRAHAAAAAE